MRKVLQKLLTEGLIFLKQFYFAASLFCPGLYIFPNIIYAFLRQDVFIIHLFFFACFGLINEFINEFDLPVNKILDDGEDEEITTSKYHYQCDQRLNPIEFQQIDSQADGDCQYKRSECR